MKDQIIIEHPEPHSLIVRKARLGGLRNMIGTLAFLTVWYGFLLAEPLAELRRAGQPFAGLFSLEGWSALLRSVTREQPCLWIFIFAPLAILPQLLKAMKISLFGEVFHFNGLDRIISRDGKQRSLFADSSGVEIRTVVDDDGPDDYRVSVLRTDGSSLFVTESDNYEQMASLADDVARVLNTPVVRVKK